MDTCNSLTINAGGAQTLAAKTAPGVSRFAIVVSTISLSLMEHAFLVKTQTVLNAQLMQVFVKNVILGTH